MKQLLQNVSTGEVTVDEVPPPQRGPASLLVATRYSLISAGTERAALEIGRASLVGKARARPDLVRKVVESARTDGIVPWRACVQPEDERSENIEVVGSHCGLGHNLAAVLAIDDRLAQAEGKWRPFAAPAALRAMYPRRASVAQRNS